MKINNYKVLLIMRLKVKKFICLNLLDLFNEDLKDHSKDCSNQSY